MIRRYKKVLEHLIAHECDGFQEIFVEGKDGKLILYFRTWGDEVFKIEATKIEVMDYKELRNKLEKLDKIKEFIESPIS